MADNRQQKGEKSKKDTASGGSDSRGGRSPTRTVEREDSENRPAAMDPAVAAQLKMLVQETVSAVMSAWRQGRPLSPARDDEEDEHEREEAEDPRLHTPNYNKATQDFKRRIPTFELGQTPFEQFKLDFELCADQSGFQPAPVGHPRHEELKQRRHECLKGLMYQCLMPKAKRLAGSRMYPTSDECKALTIKEYCAKLQLLFQSPAETETARQEFLARVQHKDESPMLYLSDKITLFERAFAQPKRDYSLLFDTTTDGLYNESLRMEMRKITFADEEEYGQKMAFHVNAIRKSVVAGDLSETDAKGTQTYSTTSSYLASQNDGHAVIKKEPGVYAMSDRNRTSGTKKLLCYFCQKPGHFARECSRKLAGLPPVKKNFGGVQAILVGDESDCSDTVYNQDSEINALRNRRRVSFRDPSRGPRNKPRRYNRRFVAQVETDETSDDENDQFEECESSPEPETQRSDHQPAYRPKTGSGGCVDTHQTPPAARIGIQSIQPVQSVQKAADTAKQCTTDTVQTLEDDGMLDLLTDQNDFLGL